MLVITEHTVTIAQRRVMLGCPPYMNPRDRLGLPRHALVLLLLTLAVGACATGEGSGDDEELDAAAEEDAPKAPPEDGPTFDLVSPLDDVGEVDSGAVEQDSGAVGVDAGEPDSGSVDAGAPDAGPEDAGALDAGAADVGTRDTGAADTGARDGGVTDSGPRDAGVADSGPRDAGGCASGQTRCAGACVDLQRDPRHCGRCGAACGETGACVAGRCTMVTCMVNASNCNSNTADDCEVIHAAPLNACPAAVYLGAYCGDVSGGFLCASSRPLRLVATRTGTRSAWYRGRINECSTICPARLDARLSLQSPPGVDYDLFVYSACGRQIGSSIRGAGETDNYTLTGGGSVGSDSADFYVEVRWLSGASCTPWRLTLQAR